MGEDIEFEGQIIHPKATFTWIKTGQTIPAGELITPVKIPASRMSDEFAALHLISNDLEFSLFSFQEALKHGVPDDQSMIIRAFISAGAFAYAKP